MMEALMQGVLSFCGALGFGILWNIRGKNLLLATVGGVLAWMLYQYSTPLFVSDAARCFVAAVVVTQYAQTMARWRKAPSSVFLVIGLVPLVPGYAAYKAMENLLLSNLDVFVESGLYTFEVVMALAMGFLVSSKVVRKPKI